MVEPEEAVLFFGRNGARLAELRGRVRFPFCWPGLLFPQAWFLYRKMYGWAALVSAGPLLIYYAPDLRLLNWGTSLLGALGLKLYFRHMEETVAAVRASAADEEEARALIARAGGVSWTGACIGAVFVFSAFVLSLKAPYSLGMK